MVTGQIPVFCHVVSHPLHLQHHVLSLCCHHVQTPLRSETERDRGVMQLQHGLQPDQHQAGQREPWPRVRYRVRQNILDLSRGLHHSLLLERINKDLAPTKTLLQVTIRDGTSLGSSSKDRAC